MPGVAAVHLVRRKNGTEPFRKFIDSYRNNKGGVDHALILVFKGFPKRQIPKEYAEILNAIPFTPFFTPDFGFDIWPYYLCARRFPFRYVCFLNSFSVLLDRDWLDKLLTWGARDGIGAAGATGSWESLLSNMIEGGERNHRVLRRFGNYFDPFPNPHLRTNAFLLRRERFLSIHHGWLLTKTHAHRFESGKNGLTRQLLEMGLETVVVGRDGKPYYRGDWPSSLTFRQEDQRNLLVADNQTRHYLQTDSSGRVLLARMTWGDHAIPLG